RARVGADGFVARRRDVAARADTLTKERDARLVEKPPRPRRGAKTAGLARAGPSRLADARPCCVRARGLWPQCDRVSLRAADRGGRRQRAAQGWAERSSARALAGSAQSGANRR